MVFLGIYRALYDYVPQSDGELAIQEGDLLFVLEKSSDDDWWKAKKKAQNEEEDEPEGLIPNNYVEESPPTSKARALYEYLRQTDEELSFTEDAILDVYDTSDPDWTLVGLKGEYGFAPANYIELSGAAEEEEDAPPMPTRPQVPQASEYEDESPPTPQSPASADPNPAAALAGLLAQRTGSSSAAAHRAVASPPPAPRQPQYTPEESEEERAPPMPQRPISQVSSPSISVVPPPAQYASPRSPQSPPGIMTSPPYNRVSFADSSDNQAVHSPHGYHLYNIHEMVSSMGKSKKMPMTLGINIPKGMIMISPEKSRDGPQREWSAEKLSHYSIEGKHVFMDLVRPSKSVDFHAGAKDTAQEIVSALGELAGMARGEGLREVFAAASGTTSGQKKGKMLYEFMAQGDDEVTVGVDDEVVILDDKKSEEWWMVRRLKNGKEGVVPSSYVEITGIISSAPPPGLAAARSTVEQNRLEEERLAKEASKAKRLSSDPRAEVGPGLRLPRRYSSLMHGDNNTRSKQRSKRESSKTPSTSKPKPDSSKTRTWTDRSGSFKVEAEFIGLRDGKIHLHKLNGVKIAVPVPKMSIEDLEYVERATGVSLDDDKPLSDIKRRSTQKRDEGPRAGISVEQKPEYDWFDFFLQCGVNPQICERYASSFHRDQMGAENLPDISDKLLRTLGLKEGDILRVMKFLDSKYGRTGEREKRSVSFGDTSVIQDGEGANGGIFSGPGGALRNNTRKGRPAPAVQTNDVVDPKAFEQKTAEAAKAEGTPTPLANAPTGAQRDGFDDNAWEVKPSKTSSAPAASAPAATAAAPAPAPPAPTGALAELSLLTPPLQPTPAPAPAPQAQTAPPAPQQQPQPTGATSSLFEQVAALPPQQNAPPRQRPMAPQQTGAQGSLIAPPPQRSSSAPQNASQFIPPPLQPQMTGYVAPPGQSMAEINQQRMQQQYMQPQQTGFMPQQTGYNQFQNPMQPQSSGMSQQYPQGQFQQPQPTGFGPFQPQQTGFQPGMQNQFIAGQQQGSPFADPPRQSFQPMMPQPTGLQQSTYSPQPLQSQQTGINSFLPPALQPQVTGMNGFGNQPQGFQPPPVPPIPQQNTMAPLQSQKTGPPPPVRFGVASPNKLTPQATGRKANLSQATPQNPFGF